MTKREEEPTVDAGISEFAKIISPPEDGEGPAVVGGHAVNLWSEYYFALGVKALAAYMPFTSKDLDLIGPAGLLERLHATHKGKLTLSDPRSPVLGRLDILRENGSLLRIEVLHGVKGLNTRDLSRTIIENRRDFSTSIDAALDPKGEDRKRGNHFPERTE